MMMFQWFYLFLSYVLMCLMCLNFIGLFGAWNAMADRRRINRIYYGDVEFKYWGEQ